MLKTLTRPRSSILASFRLPLNTIFTDVHKNRPNVSKDPPESEKESITSLIEDAVVGHLETPEPGESWTSSPYTDLQTPGTDESPEPSKVDPSGKSIILFPGQGTLKLGAVKRYLKFPRARELFKIANEILKYDLLKLCLEGPLVKFNKTEFNQPATVIASLAALEQLKEERPTAIDSCVAVAGYSVGEITALIFSGALDLDVGIRLIGIRATAMQNAIEDIPQGMLSLYCTPRAKISQACEEARKWARDMGAKSPTCSVAIYLYTQGKVLAGNLEALKYIEDNRELLGFKKVRRLPVNGAFHSQLMIPALKPFREAMEYVQFNEPRVPVYSNVTAKTYNNVVEIQKLLPKQIVAPVKWEQTLQALYNRSPGMAFPRSFDVGSGGSLHSVLKLVNAKASDHCISI